MTREDLVRSIRHFRRSVQWLGVCPGLLLGSSPAPAQTCTCPAFELPAAVKQADVIFVGKSLSATNDSTAATGNSDGDGWLPGVEFQTRLLFDVETVVKGAPPRFIEVVTPTGSCGFPFAVGKIYLVVGRRRGEAVATDACQGNVSGFDAIDARAAAIREALHPQVPVSKPTTSATPSQR